MTFYAISVDYSFRAAHAIPLAGGGSEASHWHDWHVTATYRAQTLDEHTGVAVNFLDVDRALKGACSPMDSADLSALDAFADGQATAERVAAEIARVLTGGPGGEKLFSVSITEAPRCRATYYV